MLASQARGLIFIFGQHRSGTSILYSALAAAGPLVYPGPFHIAHFADYLKDRAFDRKTALAKMTGRFQREGIAHRFVDDIPAGPLTPEEYGFALPGGRLNGRTIGKFRDYCEFVGLDAPHEYRLLLKNPRDIANITFIHQSFPDAKLIFLHRRPGPVIASRLKELRFLFREYSPYQAVIEPGYARMPWALRSAIGGVLGMESAVTLYLLTEFKKNADLMLRAMALIAKDKFLSIDYESLCAVPKRVLGDVLGFLDLPHDSVGQVAQAISPRKTIRKPNRLLDSRLAERVLKPYLDACGYDGLWPG